MPPTVGSDRAQARRWELNPGLHKGERDGTIYPIAAPRGVLAGSRGTLKMFLCSSHVSVRDGPESLTLEGPPGSSGGLLKQDARAQPPKLRIHQAWVEV